MAYKFALVSPEGEVFDSFETSEGNWKPGDVVIDGNLRSSRWLRALRGHS